jgi:transposase
LQQTSCIKWLKRWTEDENLKNRPKTGKRRKLDAKKRAEFIKKVQLNPEIDLLKYKKFLKNKYDI